MLGSFYFTTPLWLLLFPFLSAALVLLHRQSAKQKRKILPAVFLLRNLKDSVTDVDKIKLPLIFWLELFLLTLFCLFLSGFSFDSKESRQAIIIDNSLSMASEIAVTSSNLLEKAKLELQQYPGLNNLPITIFKTSDNCQQALYSGKLATVDGVLKNLKLSFSEDDLQTCLDNVVTLGEFSSYLILTDNQFASNSSAVKIRSLRPELKKFQNLRITSLQLIKNKFQLAVENKSQASFANLEVYIVKERDLIKLNTFKLPLVESSNLVEVELPSEDAYLFKLVELEDEFLKYDNYFWYHPASKKSDRVIYVADDSQVIQGLEQVLKKEISWIKPADYKEELVAQASYAIFSRFIPTNLPPINSLFILPNNLDSSITLMGEKKERAMYANAQNHQVLKYLKIKAPMVTTYFLRNPSWMESLIDTQDGPIFLAGVHAGQRYLASAIDLLPFDKDSKQLAVLFLNSIQYLSATNASRNLPADAQLFLGIPAVLGEFEDRNTPGIYERTEQVYVNNFVSVKESNSQSLRQINLNELSSKQVPVNSPLSNWLLFFAFFLAILTFFLGCFKGKKNDF